MSDAKQLQPDDEPAIQEFLNEFGKRKPRPTWRLGRVGPANNNQIPYVSGETLRTKLDLPRVQNLLNALFRNWNKPAPDADYIRKNCLRTFAILLAIGYGRMIFIFAEHPNLHDQHLPHLQEPQNFPSLTKVNLFSHFYGTQWAFCAQTMRYDMGYRLSQYIILPILQMDVIYEEGGSATMYKIQVDEDYNELQPEDDNDRRTRHQYRHTFALKTYRTKDAKKYYETESDAFKHLRHNSRPPQNIIAFYGGFERENTYNIILEFADGGSLDEFMERTPAPPDPNQLSVFWNQFFKILNGLAIIHGEGKEKGNGPYMLGWHQDINPTNILVKSRPNALCPYDVHFKIADLGLSHFKRHTSGLGSATDKDTFGTRAYGAPETYRTDFDAENSTLRVKQDVDIWSTGCILSEVVTWVSQGWNKVLDYRRRRGDEMFQHSRRWQDCFHTPWGKLLQTVHYVHNEDVERRPRHDELTPRIIDGLISEMLLSPDEHRPNAKYLYQKSTRITSPQPQSPPPKRPPLSHNNPSSRSNFLEPTSPDPRRNSLSSSNLPTALPRNRSGSFHSLSSVQNNQQRGEYPGSEGHFLPSPDENSHFNECIQAPKVDNPNSPGDQRPSTNGPAPLSPTTETESNSANQSEDSKRPPVLSVEDGLEYIRNKHPFPQEHLMEELQGRDHAFLVDNSTSSGVYRLQMKKVLELLARKVENADSSLHLYFTAPYRKLKRQNPNTILNLFESTDVRDMPDMRSCLAKILDEYQSKLGKFRPVGKVMHPKTTPFVGCRKLSLYVLTDGVWQPNVDLVQEIQTLVEHLAERKLTNKQVGIQFIRFGQNLQAIRKMKRLDSGLGFKLNIVDTTPANGNVWKMLLGSINPWFDADYDLEDTDSGYKGEPDMVGLGLASVQSR